MRTYIESAAHSRKVLAKMQSAEQHWPEPCQGFVNENHPQLFVCDAYTFVEFFQNVLHFGGVIAGVCMFVSSALSMNGERCRSLPGSFLASRKHNKNIKAEVTASSQ